MSNHLALDYQVAVQTLLVYVRRFLQLRALVARRGNTQGKVPAASGAHQQLVKRNRVRSWKGVSGDPEQVGLEGELERSEWRCGAGGTGGGRRGEEKMGEVGTGLDEEGRHSAIDLRRKFGRVFLL